MTTKNAVFYDAQCNSGSFCVLELRSDEFAVRSTNPLGVVRWREMLTTTEVTWMKNGLSERECFLKTSLKCASKSVMIVGVSTQRARGEWAVETCI